MYAIFGNDGMPNYEMVWNSGGAGVGGMGGTDCHVASLLAMTRLLEVRRRSLNGADFRIFARIPLPALRATLYSRGMIAPGNHCY